MKVSECTKLEKAERYIDDFRSNAEDLMLKSGASENLRVFYGDISDSPEITDYVKIRQSVIDEVAEWLSTKMYTDGRMRTTAVVTYDELTNLRCGILTTH